VEEAWVFCEAPLGWACPDACDWRMRTALVAARSTRTRTDATASLCCMLAHAFAFQLSHDFQEFGFGVLELVREGSLAGA
jgi:hypothetical protein